MKLHPSEQDTYILLDFLIWNFWGVSPRQRTQRDRSRAVETLEVFQFRIVVTFNYEREILQQADFIGILGVGLAFNLSLVRL